VPELLLDLVARDQATRTFHQHQQDLEGLLLKAKSPISGAQLARLQIKLEGSDRDSVWQGRFHLVPTRAEVYHEIGADSLRAASRKFALG